MPIEFDNDGRRAPLQRELPGWTLDDRTVTWLWMVLRDMDQKQRLGLRGLSAGEFDTKAMYVDMAHALLRLKLADALHDQKTMQFLPSEDLKWIWKDRRLINWLMHEVERMYRVPKSSYPPNLDQKNTIIALIDFREASISQKRRDLDRLKESWNRHIQLDNYYSWFREGNEKKKCEAAWDWYQREHASHFRTTLKFSKLDDILFSLDSLEFNREARQFHIESIKKELKRQQARSNLEGKKQTNFALPEEVRRQLDELVEQHGLTKKQIIELLIRDAAENGLPDGNRHNRSALHRNSHPPVSSTESIEDRPPESQQTPPLKSNGDSSE
jgi:hypothetical protein